ncbi:hypothetical protein RvY_17282 [Ramazzottius varieornatus]|uniref:Ephrin RBD domain-containing protein n=1 Tax=Ramazzottius varieornatus TaxID=947166 RepID=A0A1D1W208_RAMVA|nr:hypothetical protein RvY_17282 [Ramazzottius varieornatus]
MKLRKSFSLVLVYWTHFTLCRPMPSQGRLGPISVSFDSVTSLVLPCPDEMDRPFGGQLFIRKTEVWNDTEPNGRSFDIVAPSESECPGSLTQPVQLYLNIRFLRLNCSETFYLTARATANSSSWLRKNFTRMSEREKDYPRRESFGQFYQPTDHRAFVSVELEYSNSSNVCAEPQPEILKKGSGEAEETLVKIDFTYVITSTSPVSPDEDFCSCPALSGLLRYAYVHTSLVCNEDFTACPDTFHPFSDKPDPSWGTDFNCDSNGQADNGLLCPNNHYCTTEPTSSITTTKSIISTRGYPGFPCGQRTPRPHTATVGPAVTTGPAPDHPMGTALTYVAIAFSILTIMILLCFGAYVFIKERKHRREVANAPHIWTIGEVNQAMELEPNDPPPPYRPPGAPPSYGESQDGNTEVVIDMEDGYCVDADGIFFVLPDFAAELNEATPDVVADIPDSVT